MLIHPLVLIYPVVLIHPLVLIHPPFPPQPHWGSQQPRSLSAELGFGISQVLLTPSGEESGLYSPNLSALPRRARGFCSL